MDKQPLKTLLFEICVAKQRIKRFEKDPSRSHDAAELLKQLLNLYGEVCKRASAFCEQVEHERFLLFTEASPDGVIVTRDEYYTSLNMMTFYDRQQHVLFPLDFKKVG